AYTQTRIKTPDAKHTPVSFMGGFYMVVHIITNMSQRLENKLNHGGNVYTLSSDGSPQANNVYNNYMCLYM
ncbi:MAG: hypothetical protein ACKPKO_41860, partial [Candidatus Fonsibacter sp.]